MLSPEDAVNGLKEENYRGLEWAINVCDRTHGSDMISDGRFGAVVLRNQHFLDVGKSAIDKYPEYKELLERILSMGTVYNTALKSVGFAYLKDNPRETFV